MIVFGHSVLNDPGDASQARPHDQDGIVDKGYRDAPQHPARTDLPSMPAPDRAERSVPVQVVGATVCSRPGTLTRRLKLDIVRRLRSRPSYLDAAQQVKSNLSANAITAPYHPYRHATALRVARSFHHPNYSDT